MRPVVNFTPMKSRRLALSGALAGLLIAPAAVAQQAPPDYKSLFVKYGKKTVQAKLGAYCHPNAEGTGVCGGDFTRDGMAKLTIRQNGEVTLLIKHPATSVEWQASRIDGRGDEQSVGTGNARAVTKTLKRWRLKVPKNFSRSTDVLRLNVRYPYAFSTFGVATKVLRAAPSNAAKSSG